MKIIMNGVRVISCAGLLLASASISAKVSPEEAAQLKTQLTPVGAQREGNAEGTIPPYTGSIEGAPLNVMHEDGKHYTDPYPDEQPLFTITGQNYPSYQDKLSPGMIAMFQAYPETFRMPIYPSHRDARYTDEVHEQTYNNALRAELSGERLGITNAFGGVPFPIPKNGAEAIWNQAVAQIPWDVEATFDEAAVFPNGTVQYSKVHDIRYIPFYDPDLNLETYQKKKSIAAFIWRKTLAPWREAGEIIAIKQPMDFSVDRRQTWLYSPGTRRVRRTPDYGYDTPYGFGGIRTVDDDLLFNGPIDRYEWHLEGKQEMYIPYNNYRVDSPDVSYEQLLTPFHINPEYMRYELHRVWVVTAMLKEGADHIYKKRRFFLDEDSWHAVFSDSYNAEGQLFRTHMKCMVNAYDMPGMTGRLLIYHDLAKRAYYAGNLINEQKVAPRIPVEPKKEKYFTPANLRRHGR